MSVAAGEIYQQFAKRFPKPQEGALRIWWVPQIPGQEFQWPVADLTQAALLLDALAAYDDFQFAEKIKGDYANMGDLQVFADGEWIDWEDEDCDDFETYRCKQADANAAASTEPQPLSDQTRSPPQAPEAPPPSPDAIQSRPGK